MISHFSHLSHLVICAVSALMYMQPLQVGYEWVGEGET